MTPAEQLRRALDRFAGAEVSAEEKRQLFAPLWAVLGTIVGGVVEAPIPAPAVALPASRPREEVLTVKQVAAAFNRSIWWVYRRRTGRNRLPGFTPLVGGGYGFRASSIDRHIARRSTHNDV